MMIGYCSGFFTGKELYSAFDVVTEAGAKVLGLSDYGLRVGATADFVAHAAEHVPEAVVAVPKQHAVFKGGKRIHAHIGTAAIVDKQRSLDSRRDRLVIALIAEYVKYPPSRAAGIVAGDRQGQIR